MAEPGSPPHTSPRDYWHALQAATDAAISAAGGPIERELSVGRKVVRLRFAGPALVPLVLPSLSHLIQEHGGRGAAIEIDVCDGISTGVEPPSVPWGPDSVGPRGEVAGFNHDGLRTVLHGAGIDMAFFALTMFDERSGRGCFWVFAPALVPWWERAAPLRTALHFGLSGPRRLLVHAGAVGAGGMGVLLGGAGGSGKSTTAVAAMLLGLDYVGDDYVLLDLEPQRPVAYSLYCSAKLVPETRALLPQLEGSVWDTEARDGEKQVLDIGSLAAERVLGSLPVSAILLPQVLPGAPTRARAVSPGEALRRLAPSTILQLPPHNAGAALSPLAELVRRVPAYALEIGGPPGEAVEAIFHVLAEAEAA
jgi:hypothetical protein